ncbi:hypothetical protein [Roseibium sp.]|uniref:hypothetical protein n=1 Tax=Roseibium sp. TaxID=1936156 RepID=UPI00329690F5
MSIRRIGKKGTFQIYRRIPVRFDQLELGVFFKKASRPKLGQSQNPRPKKSGTPGFWSGKPCWLAAMHQPGIIIKKFLKSPIIWASRTYKQ